MLVLSRRREERIIIRDGGEVIITIKVIGVREGIVRLGFEADRRYDIIREEVHARGEQVR